MYSNWPNYKLMQQKHTVSCRYQNTCNWHECLREQWLKSGFMNKLASEVGVTILWDSIEWDAENKKDVSKRLNSLWACRVFKVQPHNTFFPHFSKFLKFSAPLHATQKKFSLKKDQSLSLMGYISNVTKFL